MDIKHYLTEHGITFRAFTHPPVFTCEQARKHHLYYHIRGIHSKNLFLKERKSRRYYLLVIQEHKKADLDTVGTLVGDKLKFANEDDLMKLLSLTPGAVSPFGLINDTKHIVEVLIDKEVWESDFVSFHPNVNTETLELSQSDFRKYIGIVGNKYRII